MLPTISTGNVASALAGEYEVANSLRFNSASSDYLEKTQTGSNGDLKKWTLSMWVKRAKLGTAQDLFSFGENNSAGGKLSFDSNDFLVLNNDYQNGGTNETDMKFRDVSAWYHIVWACDVTQSDNADRWKVYVNGNQVTLTGSPSISNADGVINRWNGFDNWIGANARVQQSGNPADYSDVYLAEVVFIDGTQLDQNSFGEFDSDSPTIWKPKDVSELTFGTNGYHLDFENASSLGADVSGNSNNFTANNLTSIDQSTDTCTNNFSVLNNLIQSSATYSDGNLTVAISSNKSLMSTIGVSSGKFYFETKINTVGSTYLGFCSERNTGANFSSYRPLTESALVNKTGNVYDAGGNTGIDSLPSIADDDIIGCALDVDNKKFWWSKNGQWYSANASSDSTINISDVEAGNNGYDFSSWTGQFVFASFGTSTNANNISVNFGSPSYSVSSPNSDANGYGAFSYTVPTNFYAINSKNLAEFG